MKQNTDPKNRTQNIFPRRQLSVFFMLYVKVRRAGYFLPHAKSRDPEMDATARRLLSGQVVQCIFVYCNCGGQSQARQRKMTYDPEEIACSTLVNATRYH